AIARQGDATGIRAQLEQWEPHYPVFAASLLSLAKAFKIEEIEAILHDQLQEHPRQRNNQEMSDQEMNDAN
ncbi:MAG: hypothetical protein ACPGVO_14880, partial [Spirulinaceae cyanobacterium]